MRSHVTCEACGHDWIADLPAADHPYDTEICEICDSDEVSARPVGTD